ncbi:MAG: glycosyltransferase family 39 protein, partial [Patescibacteria group bacterium]|nr:glycosyltransferase family 39 protein [Patescibacteria group bacterium]
MNILRTVKQYPTQLFLIFISFIFFLLRLPSLVEPYWYGDEGVYEVIGSALNHGRGLYTGIWDNKPPLLYYIYALFAGDQASVRLLSLIVGIATVLLFFSLAKKLFSSPTTVYSTTAVFAVLFGTPLLEGNIANAENFMLLPALLAGVLVWKTAVKNHTALSWKPVFLAGLLLGISFLLKVVAVFDFAAFFVFFFTVTYTSFSTIKKQLESLVGFFAGFFLPITLVFLTAVVFHNAATFIHSAFTSNVGYVGYGNYFLFPQGLLVTKLALLTAGVALLFFKRKHLSPSMLFILFWIIFSLFNALFSQRPYTHYLLVLVPSFSLFLGLFAELPKRRLVLGAGIVMLFVIVFVFAAFRPQLWKSVRYYGNYVSFTYGNESVESYLAFFDSSTVRDYELAGFINAHKKPGDTLFVWGNDGQLY